MNQLQQISPLALYDQMNQVNQLNNKAGAAQQMTQTNGWGGGAGVLGAALGGLLSGRFGQQADDAQTQYMKDAFIYEQQQARMAEAAQAEAQQQAAMQKLESLIPIYGEEKAKAIVFGGAKSSDFKVDETSLMQNLKAMGLQPGTPEFQQAMNQQLNKSNAPTVNVNSGDTETKFQEKLASKNADQYSEWRGQAMGANETLANIDKLKQISSLQQTGKTQEAMAAIGQYFGTQAGSNMQSYAAIQKKMMLDAAANLKGAMSDGEWSVLQAQMPAFGNDPRANETIMNILSDASNRSIENFKAADDYVNKNGKMRGFTPKFNFSGSREAPEQEQPMGEPKTVGGKQYIQKDGQWYEL